MSNRIPLPPPALTQHPSGNVYFSPQQMQAYADEVREKVLADVKYQVDMLSAAADLDRDFCAANAYEVVADFITEMGSAE